MKLLNHLARGMATLGEAGDEPGCTPDVRVILQRSYGWLETAQRDGYELKAALRKLERALPHHDVLGPPGDPTAVLEDAAEALEIADVLCASLAHVLAHGSHPSETCSDCNRGRVAIAWWLVANDSDRSEEELSS
jgi:hypothetical protein